MGAVQHRQPVDHLRMEGGESPGDAATPVVPHDVGALRVERADEPDDVVGEDRGAIGVDAFRLLTPAVSPEVGRYNLETLRQLGYLLAPCAIGFGKDVYQ